LESCLKKGGSLENVTVRVGTFKSCRIDDGTRMTWYGDVPLWGKIKIQNDNGSYRTELESYTWGDSSLE